MLCYISDIKQTDCCSRPNKQAAIFDMTNNWIMPISADASNEQCRHDEEMNIQNINLGNN